MEHRLKQVRRFHNPGVVGPFRGHNGTSRRRWRRAGARFAGLLRTEGVDNLYRESAPDYARCAGDFVDAYRNALLLIMATCDPAMARAGFERTRRHYSFEAALQDLLDWVSSVRRQDPEHG